MKVLLTHPSADLYGSDRMAAEAAGALVDHGHDVCVVLPADGPLVAKMRSMGAVVCYVPAPVLRKSNLRPRGFLELVRDIGKTAPAMWALLHEVRPDVMYVNTVTQPWWLLMARIRRIRSVTHVREAEPQLPRPIATALMLPLLLTDVIACNSRATQAEVTRAVMASPDRVRVIYNGKDWSAYTVPRGAGSLPRDSAGFTILVVGRLSPRKGQDIAIRSLAKLVESGVDATLRLAGDVFPGYEWFEDDLRELAASLGVEHRVEFLGFQEDLRQELATAHVAVVPSRIEPFGTVAAESMAAGVLTIVADVQGLTEIVTDEETGLTFAGEDDEALASRLLWVHRFPEDSQRICEAGRASVLQRFTIERYRTEIIEALEDVALPSALGGHGEA